MNINRLRRSRQVRGRVTVLASVTTRHTKEGPALRDAVASGPESGEELTVEVDGEQLDVFIYGETNMDETVWVL